MAHDNFRNWFGHGLSAVLLSGALLARSLCAANGTWSEATGDGQWSAPANWSGGIVADGAGNAANFNAIDLHAAAVSVAYPGFYRNAIQLDSSRTIGSLVFGDANPATPGGWEVYTNDIGANLLTLAGTTPTITVHPLGPIDTATLGALTPEIIDDAVLRTNLVAATGFTKAGNGVLTLGGTANTIAGNIQVNAGTLRLHGDFANTGATTFQLANGTTLDIRGASETVANINVAAGATATIRGTASGSSILNNVTGSGSGTLNLNLVVGGATYSADGNWGGTPGTNNFAAINVVGEGATPSVLRLRANGGSWNTNSFAATALNLNNTQMFVRTNSGGNDINIGSISGTANATLDGGNTGTVARYHVGGLNTSTTYAGGIGTGSGILLEKVGTGKLTLSGTLTYTTTNNATAVNRGGVTRITAGTLAVAGGAAIPGGITDATLGDLYTSIDVRTGAVLDVSGAATTYSTAPLQQVVGLGSIAGNYQHDEGRIRAGDALQGNGNIPTPTAGTLTFTNNLSFAGSGEIVYDMGLNPLAGNDRIQVNGTTDLTGSTTRVTPNFLTGTVPTSGTYTILNSLGGYTGTPAGWTVAWPGRGAGPTVVMNGTLLQFNAVPVAGGGNLRWTGANGSNWDIQTSQNWYNSGTSAADVYYNDDNVTFADTSASGVPVTNFAVNLPANVTPRSVTVDAANNYTLGGPGVITGTGTFAKRGAGVLTMQKANTFNGAATVESGTIDVGAMGGALGTGSLTLGGANIVGTAAGGFTNSSLTVVAGSSNVVQMDGAAESAGSFSLPTLAGAGALKLTSTVNAKWYVLGSNSAFQGTLDVGPDGITGTSMTLRLTGSSSSMPGAAVQLSNGTSMSNRSGASNTTTIALGALSGDASSSLVAFFGGGSLPGTNWEIGARGESTTFAGTINDQTGGAISSVTKVGGGTLTLSGANLYTGNTTVNAGVLSVTNPFLADGSDVNLATGAVFDLNFSGTDVIDSLFFNGASQAIGTWGSLASAATHKSPFFTGSGLLQVTTTIAPPLLVGDYNSDGAVNAADYTVWRNNLGGAGTSLANRDPNNGAGAVSQADYNSWKANFGATAGAGSGALVAVPEPATWLLLAVAVAIGGCSRRRRLVGS